MRTRRGTPGALLLALCVGCTVPPTETIVQIDTDIPASQSLSLMVTARVGDGSGPPGLAYQWLRGDDAGEITFPTSFAIIPGPGQAHDSTVTLEIDAIVGPATPGGTPTTLQHLSRFAFQPGRVTYLPVFLSVLCTMPTTGCNSVGAAECTVDVRCSEQGETCDLGNCVAPTVMPTMDGGTMDAHTAPDGPVFHPCVPNCTGRVCGPDPMCGASCGTCSGGAGCSATGQCGCPAGSTSCGGMCFDLQTTAVHCGSCGNSCPQGTTCSAGQCVCPAGQTLCGTSCVNLQSDTNDCGACGHVCPTGQPCVGGTCMCTAVTNGCSSGSQCCSGLSCLPYVSGGPDYCCRGAGAACSSAVQCCGQLQCTGGQCTCQATNVATEPTCAADEDCCSNICRSGTCVCRDAGSTCGSVRDCCSGRSCRPYLSGGPSYCCREAGDTCMSAGQCCGQMACTSGTCHCRSSGMSCAANADCCTGLTCRGGTCG